MKINVKVSIGYTDYDFTDSPLSAIAFAEEACKHSLDVNRVDVSISYIRGKEDEPHEA